MKKGLFLLFFVQITLVSLAQQSWNINFINRWDNNTLPIRDSLQYNDCWGFEKNGREYAVIGSLTKTHFIEVTNPNALTEVTNFTLGANSIWRDYKYYKGYIYGVADQGSEGLRVYNVNNINNVTNRVTLAYTNTTAFFTCHNIWIDTTAGRLYCAGTNSGARYDGIIVFDIKTNPASPVLCGNMPLRSVSNNLQSGYVHDVHVYDGKMYCSHIYTGRMDVYNVTSINNWQPGNAVITTVPRLGFIKVPNSGYNHSSYLTEDKTKLIMAEETNGRPLTIVDVEDPSNITASSTIYSCNQCVTGQNIAPNNIGSLVHNPFVKGKYAYLAYYHEGLVVYDISNPCNPVKAAYYDTDYPNRSTYYSDYYGAWGTYPYLPSGRILVSDVLNGLYILDMNYAQAPSLKVAAKIQLSSSDLGLNSSNLIPLNDPYRTSTFQSTFPHINNCNKVGTSQSAITNNNIIDWVFLELRTGTANSTTVVQTKAALLQNDGDIVDLDGFSPVSFSGTSGNYYIAVKHRNHLGFRTAQTYNLSNIVTNLNFTNNSVPLYGVNPLYNDAGTYRMIGGDANFDGSIDAFDTVVWESQNGLFNDYAKNSDYNLDGSIDAFDSIIWELMNGKFESID